MKHLIFDTNNIASIAFYRAKSLMMEEINSKFIVDKSEYDKNFEYIKNNITGFSIHLFLNKIHTIMKIFKNRRVIFVWDGKYGSSWRKKENESYKSNRTHDIDFYQIFINMMNMSRDILKFYPVIQFSKNDAEADDLMYSLAKCLDSEEATFVTTDSDMIQLAQQFNNVNIWNPISKKYHIIPEYNYILFKSVIGDKSDNIAGIPKYGNVKAKKIAVNGIDSLDDKYKSIIENNIKIIDLSKNPFEQENTNFILNDLTNKMPTEDLEQIKKIFFDLKLKQQLDQFSSTIKLIKSLQ